MSQMENKLPPPPINYQYAYVVSSYTPRDSDDLEVKDGEIVIIRKEDTKNGWNLCQKYSERSKIGWVPTDSFTEGRTKKFLWLGRLSADTPKDDYRFLKMKKDGYVFVVHVPSSDSGNHELVCADARRPFGRWKVGLIDPSLVEKVELYEEEIKKFKPKTKPSNELFMLSEKIPFRVIVTKILSHHIVDTKGLSMKDFYGRFKKDPTGKIFCVFRSFWVCWQSLNHDLSILPVQQLEFLAARHMSFGGHVPVMSHRDVRVYPIPFLKSLKTMRNFGNFNLRNRSSNNDEKNCEFLPQTLTVLRIEALILTDNIIKSLNKLTNLKNLSIHGCDGRNKKVKWKTDLVLPNLRILAFFSTYTNLTTFKNLPKLECFCSAYTKLSKDQMNNILEHKLLWFMYSRDGGYEKEMKKLVEKKAKRTFYFNRQFYPTAEAGNIQDIPPSFKQTSIYC